MSRPPVVEGTPLSRRNVVVASAGVAVIAAMTALTAYSPTLYSMFCRVTGLGGTTQVAEAAPGAVAGQPVVTVSFNADVAADLPWRFKPAQRAVEVAPGQEQLAFYEAENRSDHPVVGQAVYNVAPDKAGLYFSKIECFCFTEQTLEPGQKVQMPVSFFVDPAMLDDATTREVRDITLSYTFFIDAAATAKLVEARAQAARTEAGPPVPGGSVKTSRGG